MTCEALITALQPLHEKPKLSTGGRPAGHTASTQCLHLIKTSRRRAPSLTFDLGDNKTDLSRLDEDAERRFTASKRQM